MSAAHPRSAAAPIRQEWHLRWLAILVATALFAATAGYVGGGSRSGALVMTGTAYSGEAQAGVRDANGREYGIPLDMIFWVDSKGSLHDRGRPECLPPAGQTKPVKFAAVEVSIEGVTWRPVVWVSCRS
jgi:hypothetical protein